MRKIVAGAAVGALVVLAVVLVTRRHGTETATGQVFTSADGAFTFTYPQDWRMIPNPRTPVLQPSVSTTVPSPSHAQSPVPNTVSVGLDASHYATVGASDLGAQANEGSAESRVGAATLIDLVTDLMSAKYQMQIVTAPSPIQIGSVEGYEAKLKSPPESAEDFTYVIAAVVSGAEGAYVFCLYPTSDVDTDLGCSTIKASLTLNGSASA
jgi:hypothetical protein